VSIVWLVLFLEHQPRFQHRQLVPLRIFETSTFTCLCVVLFFVFNLSKLTLTNLSASLYPWNSSIRLYTTKSSEPIRLQSFWYPLYPFGYPILVSGFVDKSIVHRFEQTISSFFSQFFLFLPCYLLVKLIWKINPILQALGTVFASLDCVISY
jgi:hypothetical protein